MKQSSKSISLGFTKLICEIKKKPLLFFLFSLTKEANTQKLSIIEKGSLPSYFQSYLIEATLNVFMI